MNRIVLDTSMEKAKESRKQIEVEGSTTPSFSEYRSRTMRVPDRGFVRQLKKLDKEFEVVWDWGSSRWEIWKFPREFGKEPYHVITVQTKDKSYRELGADILLKLQWGDPSRFTLNELVDYFDEMDNQVRRRKAKDFRDKISDITRETKTFVNTMFIQVPKSLSVERMVSNG